MRTSTRSSTAAQRVQEEKLQRKDVALPRLASDDDSGNEELIVESPKAKTKKKEKAPAAKPTATNNAKKRVKGTAKSVAKKASPPKPKQPTKTSVDDDGDLDDDSDDEDCDIGNMLKQVQQTKTTFAKKKSPKRKLKRVASKSSKKDYGDDDDDSDVSKDDKSADSDVAASSDDDHESHKSDGKQDPGNDDDASSSSEDETPQKRGGGTNKRPKNFAQKLQQKSRRTAYQTAAKKTTGVVDIRDSDDSDSDIEIVGSHANNHTSKVNISLTMDDSSDEEDTVKPLSTAAASGQFAKARLALQQSQKYHAEDVALPEGIASPARGTNAALSNATNRTGYSTNAATASACKRTVVSRDERLGPIVRLTLKSREQGEDGKATSATTTAVFEIRKREPLKALMDNYLKNNNLSLQTAVVSFMFKNKRLVASSTPDECGMKSNNVINVDVKRFGRACAISNAATHPDVGNQVLLKLRTQSGQEIAMRIGKKERFQALMDRFKQQNQHAANAVFHFEGGALNLNTTPAGEDMEDGDIIEVVIK